MKSIKVVGPRVLVKPFKLSEVDEVYKKVHQAGLAIPETRELQREKAAIDSGVVLSIGSLAWHDMGDGTPWAKVGDKVMWARHAGKVIDKEGEESLVVINDEDVVGLIED